MIGDDIRITILGSKGQVRLGIDAPFNIDVHREEIYEKIQNKKQGVKNEALQAPRKNSQEDFKEQINIQHKRSGSRQNNRAPKSILRTKRA